jgi:hypothetical protein
MVAAVLLLLGPLALVTSAQTVPACDLTGDVVVQLFDGTALRSDLDEFAATNGPFAVAAGTGLADGYYSVHLQSFDRHSTDATSDEPQESWFIEGYGPDGSLAWTSSAVSDVPADRDSYAETVSAGSAIPELSEVRAVHAAFPDSASANSVHALCVAFIVEVEPTTTTEVSGATTPPAGEDTPRRAGIGVDGNVEDDLDVGSGGDGADAGITGAQALDDGTRVLGAQVDDPALPFTGPSDGRWAAIGSGLAVLGSLFIAAMRDEESQLTLEHRW